MSNQRLTFYTISKTLKSGRLLQRRMVAKSGAEFEREERLWIAHGYTVKQTEER